MKEERHQPEEEKIEANKGWFQSFKAKSNLHNIAVQREGAMADADAEEIFILQSLKKTMIENGRYIKRMIFSVDEIGLCWKKIPDSAITGKIREICAWIQDFKR